MVAKKTINPDQFSLFNDPSDDVDTPDSQKNTDLRNAHNTLSARISTYHRREEWEKAKPLYKSFINTHNALNPNSPIDITDIHSMFG